jgi:DNA ligase-1
MLLGNTYNPECHNVEGWMASEKLDGVRALWNGQKLLTRAKRGIHAPDWFIEPLKKYGTYLDGELWIKRGDFNRLSGHVRRKEPDEEVWRDEIKFMVFDVPTVRAPFKERYKQLCFYGKTFPDHVQVVDHWHVDGVFDVSAHLSRVEKEGGEGLILRQPTAHYVWKRSPSVLKVKTQHTDEALVVGRENGLGRNSDRMGALLCETKDGASFRVGTGFSDVERNEAAELYPDGTWITFGYYELSVDGVPRFPSFVGVRWDIALQGGGA